MIKTMFVLCLALFSINFASADILTKAKIESFAYNSGGTTSEYIRLKLDSLDSTSKNLYYHLKKSNETLLYIFTVYAQKKSLYVVYDNKNNTNKDANRPITEINTID